MTDEFQFKCELCQEMFDAVPDAMVECKADFKLLDPETGEIFECDEETRQEVLKISKDDPTIGPFLKGAACICLKCQDKLAEAAERSKEDDETEF